ncbi:hypothetical protein ASE04_28260 [Rhizobium sp. Root708]|nr:hypothetical protein ASE04_28260 [Rhizobium sp. Root708]
MVVVREKFSNVVSCLSFNFVEELPRRPHGTGPLDISLSIEIKKHLHDTGRVDEITTVCGRDGKKSGRASRKPRCSRYGDGRQYADRGMHAMGNGAAGGDRAIIGRSGDERHLRNAAGCDIADFIIGPRDGWIAGSQSLRSSKR